MFDGVLGLLVGELRRSVSRRAVSEAARMSRYGDRLYGYVCALSDAAAGCLRYSEAGDMVYVFDGRVWVPLAPSSRGREYAGVLRRASWEVLRWCSGGVLAGDLFRGEARLGEALVDGALRSRMESSPAMIGFSNGVWDFSDPLSPVRHSFSERLPVTSVRGYGYDGGARCPRWESFLASAMSPSDAATLQAFFGLGVKPRGMLGHSVEKMLWLVGSGGNGKSTCLDVLERVYGEGMFSHASLPTLLDGNVTSRLLGTAQVIGRRYNRCDEMQMSDITRRGDLLKRLCSADHVEFRRIGGDAASSGDVPFFVFSMNRMPRSGDADPALLRRLLIVRFGFTVGAEEMDTSLGESLCAEAPGIWNWCVEGYRRLASRGFLFPRSADNEAEQRRFMLASGQQMAVWLQDEGLSPQGSKRLQKPYRVPLSTLYDRYSDWCGRNACDPDCDNLHVFSKAMTSGMRGRRGLGFSKRRYAAGMYLECYSGKEIDYGI